MKAVFMFSCVCAAMLLLGPAGQAFGQVPAPGSGLDSGFFDDFDSYANGSCVVGQGNPPWECWAGGVACCGPLVDNATAASSPNSLLATMAEVEAVQVFDITSGQWQLSIQTYLDTSVAFGDGFVIMLNQFERPYAGCGTCNWSLQIHFDPFLMQLVSDFGGETTPLFPDQWVELVADIDLDADTLDVSYGGVQFVFDAVWSENVSGGGMPWIQCLDLYSQTEGMRWDDVSLKEVGCSSPCIGDLDCDGDVDMWDLAILVGDLGCTAPPPCIGDLDGDGDTDLADLCVLMSYFGCPGPPPPPPPAQPPITTLVRVPNNLGPDAATYDLKIELPSDSGGWVITDASATTGAGTFFEHANGGNGPPDPGLFGQYPELEFDSFYTMPPSWPNTSTPTSPTFPTSPVHAPTSRSAAWVSLMTIAGEGTWVLARYSIEDLPEARTTVTVDGLHCLRTTCCEEWYPFSLSVVYCPGDLDEDGDTDLTDLGILLADFPCPVPGNPRPCEGDVDGDGDTNLFDLGIFLADFPCP